MMSSRIHTNIYFKGEAVIHPIDVKQGEREITSTMSNSDRILSLKIWCRQDRGEQTSARILKKPTRRREPKIHAMLSSLQLPQHIPLYLRPRCLVDLLAEQ
jgi:hypothetical protein